MKRILLTLLLLTLLLTSCAIAGQPYDYYTFTFTYPKSWQPMSEVSETYKSGQDFFWMGILEDLTVTSVKHEGEPGAYFSVATLEQSDEPVAGIIDFMYAIHEEDIRNYSERQVSVAGVNGMSATYERAWEGQWLDFHDVWLEYGPLVYLLSLRADDLDKYQKETDMILESFTFKEN